MQTKTGIRIAFLLAGTLLAGATKLNAITLPELLVQKGVISQAEAASLGASGEAGLVPLRHLHQKLSRVSL